MKQLEWEDAHEFKVGDIKFHCATGDYSRRTDRERFILLKDRKVLQHYASVFSEITPATILEFGIFQGGSPALFTAWFDLKKFVGIDICSPVPIFDEFCRTHQLGRKIRSYYGVSQTDHVRIEQILDSEFGQEPIDAVIDDASHSYSLSRRTFEIAFPRLRPGGTYVIEDWGWAHWPLNDADRKPFEGQTPLSVLVMELMMLCASRSDLISEVRVFPSFTFVRKSTQAQPASRIVLDDLYTKRGVEIVGAQNLNFGGISRVIANQVGYLARRRLQRTGLKLHRAFKSVRSRDRTLSKPNG